jgi:TRAP-type C4-dicarboxylate transport system permease small subunit
MKTRLESLLSILFGGIFSILVIVVTIETIARKLFNVSLQGADELGGYALAIGSTLAFSLAVFGRNHIRVDVLHEKLPRWLQGWMNWFAATSMAIFAIFLCFVTVNVLTDTISYSSTAQTPWATPLIYPQSIWYAGLVIFACVTSIWAIRATYLLAKGRIETLNKEFEPKSAKEEIKEELDDLAQRSNISELTNKS